MHYDGVRRTHAGFTLIELLVVIVVLGILAGIVVFAVRGSGTNASDNAVAADARIVRTALEAYCAKFGHYPRATEDKTAMQVLVDAEFLSEPSQYNDLTTGAGSTEGNCNGERYTLKHAPTGEPPPAGGTACADVWCQGGTPGQRPHWLMTEESMIQLGNGKVLSIQDDGESQANTKSQLYDPTVAVTEAWMDVADLAGSLEGQMVLLQGGKVLVRLSRPVNCDLGICADWWLYDPSGSTDGKNVGAWEKIDHTDDKYLLATTAAVIQGGHVLIYGYDNATGAWRTELYDPEDGFRPLTSPSIPGEPLLRTLGNGMVLILVDTKTLLFRPQEPESTQFIDGGAPACARNDHTIAAALPQGEVLVTCRPPGLAAGEAPADQCTDPSVDPPGGLLACPRAQIYTPSETGGQWSIVPGCSLYCHILATLPDGRVVAMDGERNRSPNPSCTAAGSCNRQVWIFDPGGRTWASVADPPGDLAGALGVGVAISGSNCGGNCGKVLVAGYPYDSLSGESGSPVAALLDPL